MDVKNAFNCVSWERIRAALLRKGVPEYLINIVSEYLNDRSLEIGAHNLRLTAGVPQEPVLGPLQWNAFYDDIMEKRPSDTEYVCFTDDIAMLVTGKNLEDLKGAAAWAVKSTTRRMMEMGLDVAAEKTEAVLLVSGPPLLPDFSLLAANRSSPMLKGVYSLERGVRGCCPGVPLGNSAFTTAVICAWLSAGEPARVFLVTILYASPQGFSSRPATSSAHAALLLSRMLALNSRFAAA